MDSFSLYGRRFDESERKRKDLVWKILCKHFFQKYVLPSDTVLDMGAGYCEFINNILCRQKIAVDVNEETSRHAGPGVRVLLTDSDDLSAVQDASIDVVFCSNFFEHLPDKNHLLMTLQEIVRVIRPGGRLLILQPNFRLLYKEYWDFIDHHIPLTDRSLVEALELVGLSIVEVRSRFLPYTTKSQLPKTPWLVWLYLKMPIAQWLLGKQAWIVASKT